MKTRFTLTLTLLLAFTLTFATATTATAQQYVLTQTVRLDVDVLSPRLADDNTVIFGSWDGPDDYTLIAWDISRDRQRWKQDVGSTSARTIAVSSTNPSVVAYAGSVSSGMSSIRLRYTNTGNWIGSMEAGRNTPDHLVFAPGSYRLASKDPNFGQKISLWNAGPSALQQSRILQGHTDNISALAFSPGGRTLASGGRDSDTTIRLWNPNNGSNFAILRGHRSAIWDLAWSSDSSMLASISWDNTIRLWDPDTGLAVRAMNAYGGGSLAFHPNGQLLASGGGSNTGIYLWNPATGALIAEIQGDADARANRSLVYRISVLGFNSTGNQLVTYSTRWSSAALTHNRTIQVWKSLTVDVTGNGTVTVHDIQEVAHSDNYNKTVAAARNKRADVNADGKVDIKDLIAVAEAVDAQAAAPSLRHQKPDVSFTSTEVQTWIHEAKVLNIDEYRISLLQQLLPVFAQPNALPKETAVLANYPNPFNPETWIPYQLASAADVTVEIHASDGRLVRTLALGQLPAGMYQEKDRAAYWDGKNGQGEPVASGVYFYTLKAGDFFATKKMLIRK